MVSAQALARVVANRKAAGPGAADLRHDVSVLDPQLSSALLDGGGRRRSGRGRAARRAAAALHGREPCQQACRCLLRRRAVEFGRGRSRHRLHPAFRLGNPAARRREGAGVRAAAGRRRIPTRWRGWCARIAAPRTSSRTPATATRLRRSSRAPNRIGVAAGGDPPHARRPAEGRARRHDARRATAICWSAATAPARPDPAQAAWLYAQMVRWGQAPLSDEMCRRGEGGVPARSLRRGSAATARDGRRTGRRHRRLRRARRSTRDDIAGHLASWRIGRVPVHVIAGCRIFCTAQSFNSMQPRRAAVRPPR